MDKFGTICISFCVVGCFNDSHENKQFKRITLSNTRNITEPSNKVVHRIDKIVNDSGRQVGNKHKIVLYMQELYAFVLL